jgi:GTP-binding protein HflX
MQGMRCGEVLLADTVGFVSDLPHALIAAFRATLQEAREADLLLHVIDAADPYHAERQRDVETVLDAIGAGHIPVIRVVNKIDRTGQSVQVISGQDDMPVSVSISAQTGAGIEELRQAVSDRLSGARISRWIELQGRDARLRAHLFELGVVNEEKISPEGSWMLRVDVPLNTAQRLARLPGSEGSTMKQQLLSHVAHTE